MRDASRCLLPHYLLTAVALISFCVISVVRVDAAVPAQTHAPVRQHAIHHKRSRPAFTYPTPIQHVIVVVQENRSLDNLFSRFPGATVAQSYQGRQLAPIGLNERADPIHTHGNIAPNNPTGFVLDYNGGLNNGWDWNTHPESLTYVQQSAVEPYYDLASQWVLADEMFQLNEGPSLEAHQELIAAQTGGLQNVNNGYPPNFAPQAEAENPGNMSFLKGGCDNPQTVTVPPVDMSSSYPGNEQGLRYNPCIDYPTIFDSLDKVFGSSTVNWKYYTPTTDIIWDAPYFVNHLYQNAIHQPNKNVVTDDTGGQFQSDVLNGKLAPVTYVMPCTSWSDHPAVSPPLKSTETGPNWVNFIVNTIGNTSGKTNDYWKNTTILVTWDDWGGYYDHMTPFHNPNIYQSLYPPPYADPYEYGYRVPMLAISPYLKTPGQVDHYPVITPIPNPPIRTQASILGYIESVFGLPSLNAADSVADNLNTMFNYQRQPIPFKQVPSTLTPSPFPAGPNDCTEGNDQNLDG